jgi:hypothetical protein
VRARRDEERRRYVRAAPAFGERARGAGDVPKVIDTGSVVVQKSGLEQPRIRELLSPDLKRWLKE